MEKRKKLQPKRSLLQKRRALSQLKKLEKLGKPLRLAAEKWGDSWKSLVSIILSARTRDEVTIEVCSNLFKKYNTLDKLARAKSAGVCKIIKPVNYYKTKTRHIIAIAKILEHKEIPLELEELLKLPGVGRKTANVFLSEMGKKAIGVDTHVSQISQRLGWTTNKDPHKIEEDLKALFPKKYWNRVNAVLVRFGRTYRGKKQEEILKRIKDK